MRFYLCYFLFTCSVYGVYAQQLLPKNESGKYTYMEVEELSVPVQQAITNAQTFIDRNGKQLKSDGVVGDTALLASGKMVLYKGSSGIGRPSAEASYQMRLDLRPGKYKIILTEFVVTPYQRDRYGNFVPTTLAVPLEREPDKLGRGDWQRNMASIIVQSKKLTTSLKASLKSNHSKETSKPATISTKSW